MYNKLLFHNSKSHQSLELLFSKDEVIEHLKWFSWLENEWGILENDNNFSEYSQFEILIQYFPQLKEINFENFDYSFWDTIDIKPKTIKQELMEFKSEIGYKAFPILGLDNLSPINGKQCIDQGNNKVMIWHANLGLFEYLDCEKNKSLGFYGGKYTQLLFLTRNSLDFYRYKMNELANLINNMNMKGKMYRTISVYDRKTKEIKYRILNNTFGLIPLLEIITPHQGDEFLLEAYEIDKKIAKKYNEYTGEFIDFNFTKNMYFFETYDSKHFGFKYKDFEKSLESIN